jgi:hypothetical protein
MLEGDEVTDRTTGEVADQEGGNYLLVPYHLLSNQHLHIRNPALTTRREADLPTYCKKWRQGERYFMSTVGILIRNS